MRWCGRYAVDFRFRELARGPYWFRTVKTRIPRSLVTIMTRRLRTFKTVRQRAAPAAMTTPHRRNAFHRVYFVWVQVWALLANEAVLLGDCGTAAEYLAAAQKHNDAFQDRDNIIR